jgi:hypothetical protein
VTEPFEQPDVIRYSHLLAASYLHWTKRPLIESDDIARALYCAPLALVSHGTEADPIFRYANKTAQTLFGIGWQKFTRMPSRLSAEPVAAEERQRLLDTAAKLGYVDNYQGIRITAEGKRFMIKDTVLWNVVDGALKMHGQAAAISRWEWL